ncbi:MAG TPA: prolyl oligopeptidase family serine peptidase, partial [Terriglobales bacterium]|nr:prolyl oligopeptidase family serine peptidase [Terriglobales bacterium]
PGTRATISMVQTSRTAAYVYGTENISGRLWRLTFVRDRWVKSSVHIPDHGTLTPLILDPRSTSAFFVFENFLNPPTLYEVLPGSGDAQTLFKSQAQFAANNMLTEQFLVPSADGVPIPYFVVRHRASEASPSPTLIYAYGGHGSPALPYYQGVLGRLWLEKGGVFVLANVRGGGEFGPAWHVVGRQREHTYDDLTAVANDLVKRRITTPRKLAIKGHSAGGLLAAVMITQHPALFRAAILEAGYLDQFRPDLTLAGGEIYGAEFGSTESPEDRAFLERTSPYQNLRKVAGPPVPLIITSTSDTRISPAQSRRFAAKMASLRMPYLFFETQDGGHALAATPASQAKLDAMEYVFLAQQLMDDQ